MARKMQTLPMLDSNNSFPIVFMIDRQIMNGINDCVTLGFIFQANNPSKHEKPIGIFMVYRHCQRLSDRFKFILNFTFVKFIGILNISNLIKYLGVKFVDRKPIESRFHRVVASNNPRLPLMGIFYPIVTHCVFSQLGTRANKPTSAYIRPIVFVPRCLGLLIGFFCHLKQTCNITDRIVLVERYKVSARYLLKRNQPSHRKCTQPYSTHTHTHTFVLNKSTRWF